MRLMERRSVVFPQPDGPMRAVIWLRGMRRLTPSSAWNFPYQRSKSRISTIGSGTSTSMGGFAAGAGEAMGVPVPDDIRGAQEPSAGAAVLPPKSFRP